MIVDAALALVFGLLSFLASLFPTFTLTPVSEMGGGEAITTYMHDAGLALGKIDGWMNTSLLLTLLVVFVSMLGAWVAIWLALWTYRHLPGKGT